jgi:glycosyltransferase involved in cell wall biosynthesis
MIIQRIERRGGLISQQRYKRNIVQQIHDKDLREILLNDIKTGEIGSIPLNTYSLTILVCVHSRTYFYDNLLIQALDSLEQQTYKNFNIVIALDECWDMTIEKIKSKKLSIPYVVKSKPRKEGLALAKNFGISEIDTELIGFLDADDLYTPRKLEKQIAYLKQNPNIDFLGTYAFERILSQNKIKDHHIPMVYNEHEEIIKRLPEENILIHGSMIIKREVLKRLNGYRNVKGQEDYDLWKRAMNYGYRFHQYPERLYIWTRDTSVPR